MNLQMNKEKRRKLIETIVTPPPNLPRRAVIDVATSSASVEDVAASSTSAEDVAVSSMNHVDLNTDQSDSSDSNEEISSGEEIIREGREAILSSSDDDSI